MPRTAGPSRMRRARDADRTARTMRRRPDRSDPLPVAAGPATEPLIQLQRLIGNALTRIFVGSTSADPPSGDRAPPPSIGRALPAAPAIQRTYIQVEGVQKTPEQWADELAPDHERDEYLAQLRLLLGAHNEPLILHAMSREKFVRLVGEEVEHARAADNSEQAPSTSSATGAEAAEEWLPARSRKKKKKKKTPEQKEAQLLADFDRALPRQVAQEQPARNKNFGGRLDGFEGIPQATVWRAYHGVEIKGLEVSGLKRDEHVRYYVTTSSKTPGIAFDVTGHIHDSGGDTRIPVFVIHIPA